MSASNKTPIKANAATEENPITPPRPRIICPGCSTEITVHHTLGKTEAFMYATKVDMKKLGLDCANSSCKIYIEGLPEVPAKVAANPNIIKYVSMAKQENEKMEAQKKKAQDEAHQRKKQQEQQEYSKYNPFSGGADGTADDKAAHEASPIQERPSIDQNLVDNQWKLLMEAVQANVKKAEEEEKEGRSHQE